MKKYARETYPNVSYTVEQTERLGDIYTDIGIYVSSMQAEWVTNGSVEEGWDSYIVMLNQMGYEEFIQIEIDAYNKIPDKNVGNE